MTSKSRGRGIDAVSDRMEGPGADGVRSDGGVGDIGSDVEAGAEDIKVEAGAVSVEGTAAGKASIEEVNRDCVTSSSTTSTSRARTRRQLRQQTDRRRAP